MVIDGSKLSELRRERRLTQEQLAERANISARQVTNLEGARVGDPKLSTLSNIAAALDIPLTEFITAVTPEPATAAA